MTNTHPHTTPNRSWPKFSGGKRGCALPSLGRSRPIAARRSRFGSAGRHPGGLRGTGPLPDHTHGKNGGNLRASTADGILCNLVVSC